MKQESFVEDVERDGHSRRADWPPRVNSISHGLWIMLFSIVVFGSIMYALRLSAGLIKKEVSKGLELDVLFSSHVVLWSMIVVAVLFIMAVSWAVWCAYKALWRGKEGS